MTSAVAKKLKEEHLIPEGTTAPPGLRWGGGGVGSPARHRRWRRPGRWHWHWHWC